VTIYFLTPENNKPSGGVKVIYRHTDILNRNGIDAAVLHQQRGFRAKWFDNATRINYLPDIRIRQSDYLVIPEVYGPNIIKIGTLPNIEPGVKKVIFNQGCYNTFLGYSFDSIYSGNLETPYTMHDEFIAAIVVSENSRDYLQFMAPALKIFRVHNSIDPDLFSLSAPTNRQICFCPDKHAEDALQVLAILQLRGVLDNYKIVPITGMPEQQVADVMRESSFFLSTGYHEGFGLPPAEAIACGCIVIGYDGMGGREYFRDEFTYPVPLGDIIAFATTVEKVVKEFERDPESLQRKSEIAAAFIRKQYALATEEQDIVDCWNAITGNSIG
jgi:glycosyltransferase involved in cell wall biosynthesis